jgi:DNA-binding MarR family transcriptional regulator
VARTTPPADFYSATAYNSGESVGYLMKRAVGSIVCQADKRLEAHGLTSAQWGPLLMLQKAGPLPGAELARGLVIDAGAMTRLLDRLEKKQLCKRVRSTDDRRVVQVELTPQGAAAIAEVPAVLVDVLNAHLAGFSKTEWQALKGYLQRLVDNGEALRAADAKPPA